VPAIPAGHDGKLSDHMRNAVLPAIILIATLLSPVYGQNPRGSLLGTVQDATGARIASADVELQAKDSSLRRESSSKRNGEFRLDDLLPGTYRITVEASGFAPAQAEVVVAVSLVREVRRERCSTPRAANADAAQRARHYQRD
jgi:hypothetical protein